MRSSEEAVAIQGTCGTSEFPFLVRCVLMFFGPHVFGNVSIRVGWFWQVADAFAVAELSCLASSKCLILQLFPCLERLHRLTSLC